MALIAVGSLHGSPGATTTALDLGRLDPTRTLVVEADPDGGRLAARLDLALSPGLTELAGAARAGIAAADLYEFAQRSTGGLAVIAAHPAAEQVNAALRTAGRHIAVSLRSLGHDAIVDVGRLRPDSPALPFAAAADVTVVLCDNSLESTLALIHRANLLDSIGPVMIVLRDHRPFSMADLEAVSGRPVWGVLGDHGAVSSSHWPPWLARRATRRAARQREATLRTLRAAIV